MMKVIQFRAQTAVLNVQADIPKDMLQQLRKDLHLQPTIKAIEAYMTYDQDGGLTITLIIDPSYEGKTN